MLKWLFVKLLDREYVLSLKIFSTFWLQHFAVNSNIDKIFSVLLFSHWLPGEPNNYRGEDCVEIHNTAHTFGKWNDIKCRKNTALCEIHWGKPLIRLSHQLCNSRHWIGDWTNLWWKFFTKRSFRYLLYSLDRLRIEWNLNWIKWIEWTSPSVVSHYTIK